MSKKINLVIRLQHWMDSVPGQTFLNYAYSWGAAIVILGALFKLTHLPGGNSMLFLGMGTEVVVFFLSAFDRPFDKNEIGRELPPDYETDEEIAARLGIDDEEEDEEGQETLVSLHTSPSPSSEKENPASAEEVRGGGATIIGGTSGVVGGPAIIVGGSVGVPAGQVSAGASTPSQGSAPEVVQQAIKSMTPEGQEPFTDEAERLATLIRAANDELLRRAQAALSPGMEEATQEYIDKLRNLAETFAKVDEQSARLAKDSEEMENLNRTLTGINKVYELHLKGISLQVGTIEEINSQTQKLAQQIEDLNRVYGRMIEALTVNMRGTAPAAPQA